MHDGTIPKHLSNRKKIEAYIRANETALENLLKKQYKSLEPSILIEAAVNRLAIPPVGLPLEFMPNRPPGEKGTNYLRMQNILSNVRLAERIAFGELFQNRIALVNSLPQGFETAVATSLPQIY